MQAPFSHIDSQWELCGTLLLPSMRLGSVGKNLRTRIQFGWEQLI